MAAQKAPLSLGFSRQEHWSGLPFPSPKLDSEKWKWSHLILSDSLRPHGLQPTRLLRPWDFPGKSTGVGATASPSLPVLAKLKTSKIFIPTQIWSRSIFLAQTTFQYIPSMQLQRKYLYFKIHLNATEMLPFNLQLEIINVQCNGGLKSK